MKSKPSKSKYPCLRRNLGAAACRNEQKETVSRAFHHSKTINHTRRTLVVHSYESFRWVVHSDESFRWVKHCSLYRYNVLSAQMHAELTLMTSTMQHFISWSMPLRMNSAFSAVPLPLDSIRAATASRLWIWSSLLSLYNGSYTCVVYIRINYMWLVLLNADTPVVAAHCRTFFCTAALVRWIVGSFRDSREAL